MEGILDYFQEGLRIPPTKVWEEYREQPGVVGIIAANTRTPEKVLGDLRAQRSALRVGELRLVELAARYGYAHAAEPGESVTWKLSAIGGAPRVALAKAPTTPGARADKGRRRAYFPETGGWIDCPIYDRYGLAAGAQIAGPAIVEERESTSVLPPGTLANVDDYANLIVTVERA